MRCKIRARPRDNSGTNARHLDDGQAFRGGVSREARRSRRAREARPRNRRSSLISIFTGLSRGGTFGVAVSARFLDRPLHPANGIADSRRTVREVAANPDRGGLGVERHADALAFEVLGQADAGALVDENEAVAEHTRGKHRKGNERAVAAAGHADEFGSGKLRQDRIRRFPTRRSKISRGASMGMYLRSMPSILRRRCAALRCGRNGRRRRSSSIGPS